MRSTKKKINTILKKFANLYDLDYAEMAEILNMRKESFTNKINAQDFYLKEIIALTASRDAQIAIIKDGNVIFTFEQDKEN